MGCRRQLSKTGSPKITKAHEEPSPVIGELRPSAVKKLVMRMLPLLTQGFSTRRWPHKLGDYVTSGSQQDARSPLRVRRWAPGPIALRLSVDYRQEREQHSLASQERPDHDRQRRDGYSGLRFPASTVYGRRAPSEEAVGPEAGAVLGGAVALLLPAGCCLLVVVPAQRKWEAIVRRVFAPGLNTVAGH